MGGYFSSVDLEMGVASTYNGCPLMGTLYLWSTEIAGTAVSCPLMRGVCLWKVSVSRGPTVTQNSKPLKVAMMCGSC